MLNIIYSYTNKDGAEYALKLLKCRDKNLRHIVFTPDRANLIYQTEIFDLLDEDCLFDVDITTISRFASRFCTESKVLTKQGGISIVKKILLENRKQLKIFSKSVDYNGFALSLFESICMFKSCKITPDKINLTTKSGVLNDKLKDLKFVYEKYEEYLQGEYTDSFSVLNLCANLINRQDYKDTVFYFVGFDDFTKQGLYLIEKMAKCSKDVFVSIAFSNKDMSNNYSIFDSGLMSALIDLCKVGGIKYNLIKADASGDEIHKILKKNLFGYNLTKQCDTKNIGICEYKDANQEVENTVKYIRYLLQKENLRYSDFSIVVPDMIRYKPLIKEHMAEYDITFYLDETGQFADNVICRFVRAFVGVVDDSEQIFVLLNMPFVDVDVKAKNDFLNQVQKYGLMGKALLASDVLSCDYMTKLNQYINDTKAETTVSGYLKVLGKALEDFALAGLENCAGKYYECGLVLEYKKISQAVTVLTRVLDELGEVLGDYTCSHKVFSDLFGSFVENINLTLPPIVVDSIFVGDMETSFLQKTKYTFILGCNEGNVPNYSAELGLFSDKEIGLMPQSARLNPTIALINKRKKSKVFENIVGFGEYLLVSFVDTNGKSKVYPSAFIDDIKTLFGIDVHSMSWIETPYVFDSLNPRSAVFNNLSQGVIDKNYSTLLRQYDFMCDSAGFMQYLSTLNHLASNRVLDSYNFENKYEPICEKLFLKNGKIGVSEIECFNMCPYKHFVEYGLKIRDKKGETFDAIDNGQIIHEFLKVCVPILEKRQYSKVEIRDMVVKYLEPILSKEEYLHLIKNPYNKANIKALKNECVRLIGGIVYQLNNSKFTPFKFEKPFSFDVGQIGVNKNKVVLVGVIDRIDKFDDYYVVVDYKTGNTTMDDYKDIKSGKKWQLIVYSYVESKNGLIPAGCFYLPIKNDFSSKDAFPYQMQGVLNSDIKVIDAMDIGLNGPNYKSKIVPLETTKNGIKENAYFKNMCLNMDQITKLNEYVFEKVEEKLESILSGEVEPKPLEDGKNLTCSMCKYLGLCNFNTLYQNKTNKVAPVKNISQLLGEVADE